MYICSRANCLSTTILSPYTHDLRECLRRLRTKCSDQRSPSRVDTRKNAEDGYYPSHASNLATTTAGNLKNKHSY